MKQEGIIKFERFFVDKFSFQYNRKFKFDEFKNYPLDIKFDFKESNAGKKFLREITVDIFSDNFLNDKKPFYLSITIVGIFSFKNFDKNNQLHINILKRNTAAILFPYVRSIVSHVTMEAQIPAVILPTINLAAYFDQEK